jgi:hypothetical protein
VRAHVCVRACTCVCARMYIWWFKLLRQTLAGVGEVILKGKSESIVAWFITLVNLWHFASYRKMKYTSFKFELYITLNTDVWSSIEHLHRVMHVFFTWTAQGYLIQLICPLQGDTECSPCNEEVALVALSVCHCYHDANDLVAAIWYSSVP